MLEAYNLAIKMFLSNSCRFNLGTIIDAPINEPIVSIESKIKMLIFNPLKCFAPIISIQYPVMSAIDGNMRRI